MRIEILQHPAPYAVDAAMRLIDDDQIEGLRRQRGAIGDGDRNIRDVVVHVRVVVTADFTSLDEPEHPLNRRDGDRRRSQQTDARQLGHVVQLGEAPTVVRGAEVLELCERLIRQIVAVDQKQNLVEAAVF